MDLDQRLPDLMNRAVSTLDPHTGRLVAGGIARGKTRRRRRYVGLGAEVVMSAAVLAALVVVAMQFVTARPHGSATQPALAPTSPTVPPPPKSTPVRAVAVTPQIAAQTLIDLVPRYLGKVGIDKLTGRSAPGQALTEVVIDDGHGAAQVDVAFSYPVNGQSSTTFVCDDPSADKSGCSTTADGTKLWAQQGYEYPADPSRGAREWSVSVLRPNGLQVDLSEWNAPAEKDAPQTRPAPPLTIAQLTAIATSKQWRATVPATEAAKASKLFHPDPPLH